MSNIEGFRHPWHEFSETLIEAEHAIRNTRPAKQYFNDGSIEAACPPLKAILYIMAKGNYKGKTIEDKSIRDMFTREHLLKSNWYVERLITKQINDNELWQKHIAYLKDFLNQPNNRIIADEMQNTKAPAYLKNLNGWLGTDPLFKKSKK